jgi:ankyrin repeat protein
MRSGHFLGCMAAFLIAATTGFAAGQSRVADAAMKSDTAAVRALIQQKADVNVAQVDGATALHWAVHRDNVEMADALIKAGADVKAATRDGVTALSMAALYGNPRMIALLIEAGADPKQRGPNGETMLMFAARNGNPETIKLLVAKGAEVNARETLRGTTALMWAAEQRHPEAVKALLEAGADHSLKSAGTGVPRNYLAPRVNVRNVEEAQRRRQRAQEAGRTYEEQLDFETANGANFRGGSPGGAILPGQGGAPAAGGRVGGAGAAAPAPQGGAAQPAQGAAPAAQGAAAPQQAQAGGAGAGRGRGGAGRNGGGGQAGAAAPQGDQADSDDNEVVIAGNVGSGGGGLTALVFAAREGDLDSAKLLVDAGADVNLATTGSWTPLLTAINNRNYRIAAYLLEHGANPNRANVPFGWTPLYLATDNRNIEGGDYPVPKPDMDNLEIIKLLLDKGADVNGTIKDNTLTRTIFTMQWFFEAGATPFIRASQSSDTELMKLLLKYGADPKAKTANGDNALTLAGGIGWVDGVTFERSQKENVEAVKMLLDLGLDPNGQNNEGRTPLMGAALKGRNEVVQMLVDKGAKLDTRDRGSRDTHIVAATIAGHTWEALDYAEGLVRVGVQSATARPETAALIRKLMADRGMKVPPANRTVQSICIVEICQGIP